MPIRWNGAYQDRRDSIKWWSWRAALGIAAFWLLLALLMPFLFFCFNEGEFGLLFSYADYWKRMAGDIFLPLRDYWKWLMRLITDEPVHTTWRSFFLWRILALPSLALWIYEFWLPVRNPYSFEAQFFGNDHEAWLSDVKKMGLLEGKHLFLGLYQGRKLKLPDTRSVFCIGAPGCGKTMGVVVPAILEMNNASLIINDPKGELAQLTSGHRATLGPVYKMNWAGMDEPEKGIRWPSWNPLATGNLSPLHAGLEGDVDGLVSYLIPDGPTGTDPYWVKAGRGCLAGLTGYLCVKVQQAQANDYFLERLRGEGLDDEDYRVLMSYYNTMRDLDEVREAVRNAAARSITLENYLPIGKWGSVPENWRKNDPSFAMLLDIITNMQISINYQLSQRKKEQDLSAANTDAWKEILEDAVLETAYYGYGRRTLLELSQVLSLPEKQRGSVLSMALSGINIFKNSAVRVRTSFNDFTYKDLRGVKDKKTGAFKPVTIYMSVPYADISSSVLLSTLFINMATGYLMLYGPSEEESGPFPMAFILDEFQHMPSLDSISDGIVFGRSKQNMFLVCVQDWHQISAKYKEETTDVILSAVAVKIIKRHNNPETRTPLLKGTGSLTKVVDSYSQDSNPFKLTTSYSHKIKMQSDSVVGGGGILTMATNKQLVLYSGHLNRPIRADTPLCYQHPAYKALSSLPPAPAAPKGILRPADEEETLEKIQLEFK